MSYDWNAIAGWVMVGMLVVAVVGLLITITHSWSMPVWAKEACSKCTSGKMRWLKGQDSGSTGEALFICKSCGHKENRGGWASELAMETWDARR